MKEDSFVEMSFYFLSQRSKAKGQANFQPLTFDYAFSNAILSE